MLFETEINKPKIVWNAVWIEIITDFFKKIKNTWSVKNPFIIISWPANIGKSTALADLSHQLLWFSTDRDMLHIRDLSDIWSNIKESNKLTWRSHIIKIESDKNINISKTESYNDLGAREINSRLSISPSDKFKIVLIENIERMNDESANAFLKNLEEPLPNRLIIATTSNIYDVINTIKSRGFVYQRNAVSDEDINIYISWKYSDLSTEVKNNIIKIASWRIWIAIKLAEDKELLTSILSFAKLDKNEKYFFLKNLNDKGDVYGFLDLYIWYMASIGDTTTLPKYLNFLKYNKANLWLDNILFDLVMN